MPVLIEQRIKLFILLPRRTQERTQCGTEIGALIQRAHSTSFQGCQGFCYTNPKTLTTQKATEPNDSCGQVCLRIHVFRDEHVRRLHPTAAVNRLSRPRLRTSS